MITECCICRNRKFGKIWKQISAEDRREEHFRRPTLFVSHGYCAQCYILLLKANGFSSDEINNSKQAGCS